MQTFDIFNGDADGICSLIQLRLSSPKQSTLITGVKRDIQLLAGLEVEKNDEINILDISLDKNRSDLERLLKSGARIFYCDHHFSGDIPLYENLESLINTASDVCTSVLINKYLDGKHLNWAIVGTFGDNLKKTAMSLAKKTTLTSSELSLMEKLGIFINYNAYGSSLDDLHFDPAELYSILVKFNDPLDFIKDDIKHFEKLSNAYSEDMRKAASAECIFSNKNCAAYLLPDEKWARRVSGVFGNLLANKFNQRAHAVITKKRDGDYLVSVRAPLSNKINADVLCKEFPSGGGRKAAAGINALPSEKLSTFLDRLKTTYS